ncbi:MAG TPA: DUF3500 domain-containing protein [Saprospiraceae bacterium]|nr:DUF3500 domain-containing protein [Saprospiraceae bacterium]
MKYSSAFNNHYWLCIFMIVVTTSSHATASAIGSRGGVDQANVFIQSLRPEQMAKAVLPFYGLAPHEWSFYPASLVFPNGVAVKDLDSVQQNLLYTFMKGYLSQDGYDRTRAIMDLENVLHVLQPANPHRIPDNYFMAIYGTPHADSTWGWSFQGHHVVLNFTIVKEMIAYTPFFFGSNPAEIKEGPSQGFRAISAEEDIAYSLINSLSAEQLKKAVFQTEPFIEIVTFMASQVSLLPQVGIPASEMSGVQKNLLHLLLSAYLSAMPDDIAATRLQRIKVEDGDMIYFGWAGSVKKGEPHYYRIQGKTFLVEFDNTQNKANHIHMVWRDFEDDFGRNLLLEHYQHDHQH